MRYLVARYVTWSCIAMLSIIALIGSFTVYLLVRYRVADDNDEQANRAEVSSSRGINDENAPNLVDEPRCFYATAGRTLRTSWFVSSNTDERRRSVLLFASCGDTWRMDSDATPQNGVFTIRVGADGSRCSAQNSGRGQFRNSSSCAKHEFHVALARWRITDVHVIIDRSDLDPDDSVVSGRLPFGDMLRCYVTLLEAIVTYDRTVSVFFHVDERTAGLRSTIVRSSGADGSGYGGVLPSDGDHCLDSFLSYNGREDYSDMLLTAAYSFTGVYEKLYGLRARLVVHPWKHSVAYKDSNI